jgi:short-subunit dehydrogenase
MLDVSKRKNVQSFAKEVLKRHGRADILINNAGVALQGKVEDTGQENFEWIVGINTWGAVYSTQAFLPALKTRPEAFIVNISSMLGLVGAPTQSAYCLSKFAIRGFTEALRMDIKMAGLPVTVICVHPGSVKTNIARNSRIENTDAKTREKYVNRFDKSAKMTAQDAARIIIKGIMKKKQRILVGRDARLADIIQRLMPAGYDRFILSGAKKMRKIKS